MDKHELFRMSTQFGNVRPPAAGGGPSTFPRADQFGAGLPGPEPGPTEATSSGLARADLRARLLRARELLPDRAAREARLVDRASRWLRAVPAKRLAFWFPTRGEPDLRAAVGAWLAEDPARIAALPVIVDQHLEFLFWTPEAQMIEGRFGIAVPQAGIRVVPQLLLIPCVGIDRRRYRLGYGGGYYDRTVPLLASRPVTVGVAFDCARIDSIDPQPHDLRLDLAITESGVW